MQVGDLVTLSRHGWEKTVGIIIERVVSYSGEHSQARVLWGTTGKVGICYIMHLEVINESR